MVSDLSLFLSLCQSSLNPCCNGRWSPTREATITIQYGVLILVVMEDGLRQTQGLFPLTDRVLILVVMEDGLRLTQR